MEKVGIIGTGIQGTAIVQQLIANGVSVQIYDHIEAQMAKSIELGAIPHYGLEGLLESCNLIFLILPAGLEPLKLALRSSFQDTLQAEHLIVQMGTTSVETTHRMQRALERGGASFVECIIGGPIIMITEGNCPLFYAGQLEDCQRIQPLCDLFGEKLYVGEIGKGAAFNIASLAHVYAVVHGFSLASAMIERAHLDVQQWLDFVNEGIAGHPGEFLTTFLWPAHLEGRNYGLLGPAQVKNNCAQQEASLIAEQARALHLDTGLVNAINALHQKAINKGETLDWSSFYEYLAPVQPLYFDGSDDRSVSKMHLAPKVAFQAKERLQDLDVVSLLQSLPDSSVTLKVREGLRNDDPIAHTDMTMQEISELFRESAFSDIPILDREEQRFLGIVSEGDLLRALLPDFSEVLSIDSSLKKAPAFLMNNARHLMDRSISSIVISDPIVLHPEQDILAAAVMMVEKMIRRLPVVEDGIYLGSISRSDICWAVLHQAKESQQ